MANDYPGKSASIIKYNPQLDGLRFCAVLLVVSYHWLPVISSIKTSFFFGGMVNFFFVLSSYLITRILFSAKDKGIKNDIPKHRVISVFLLRRTIRIFPAYYFFLLVVLLIPATASEIRNNAATYFTYLSNFQAFQSHSWPLVTSHFWTLAVEEQFYLVWPLLIIFIPRRHLLKTFAGIIAGSILLKAFCYYPAQGVPQDILTQFCVDAFAVGGILAYKPIASDKERRIINKCSSIIVYAGIPLGIVIIFFKSYYFSFVFNRFLFAAVSMKIIEGAIIGYKSYFGKFLQNKVVLYLGRISYGIYLYHLLIPVIFWQLHDAIYNYAKTTYVSFFAAHQKSISAFEYILSSQAVCFIVYALGVIVVAAMSSKFIEQPFSRLKQYITFSSWKPVSNRVRQTAAE